MYRAYLKLELHSVECAVCFIAAILEFTSILIIIISMLFYVIVPNFIEIAAPCMSNFTKNVILDPGCRSHGNI